MSFKTTAIHGALAALLAAAAAGSHAATFELGAATPGVPLSFNSQVPAVGGFIDTFKFSLPANAGSGYSVIDFPLNIEGVGSFKTIFSSIALFWTGGNGVIGGGDDQLLGTSSTPGPGKVSLTIGPTAAGNYFLNVYGQTDGTLGGLYNGSISVTAVSPVPEPENYAMFLAGLGVMGAIALRRRSKSR